MNDLALETLAADVAKVHKLTLPVDLDRVCKEEGIEMAPGHYPAKFHGRLEFHPQDGVFILYYPFSRSDLSLGRIRFSICHELGHYYIKEHRDLIVSGKVHNSVESFRPVKNRIEAEADMFASLLLIPETGLRGFMGGRKELSLEAILQLGELAKASVQATAFRYVLTAAEPCVAIATQGGKVIKARSSPAADGRGFGGLGNRFVPEGSSALRCLQGEPYTIVEGHTHTSVWFSERNYGARLWEESARVGNSDYAITMLSWPDG